MEEALKSLVVLLGVIASSAAVQAQAVAQISNPPPSTASTSAPETNVRSRADTDGDGLVSQDEYLAVANRRFGRMDANGDGVVDQAELDAAAQKIYESIKARMQKQWEAADVDKDGRLSKAEDDVQAGKRFARLDKDKDGKLKPEDFRTGRRQKRKPSGIGN